VSGPEGTNGTRLVRMSVELFEHLSNTATSIVQVDWGEPVAFVWPSDGTAHRGLPEPVYEPRITKHFRDDLDSDEIADAEEADGWM
jgi:hypothetical protein